MSRLLSLLFVPQEQNNHRALLLHPSFLGLFIALYLFNQSLIRSLTIIKPGVLGYSSEITVQKVVDMTNAERQKQGLSPLQLNSVLSQSAALKAQDMFHKDYWAHNSPDGLTPWDFFRQADYQYSVAGENLAKDFYDTDSMVKAWMKSPTHRDNIVSPKYQEIGIAVVNGVLNGVKTTLVVQHFGTPLNPAPVAASAADHTTAPAAASAPVADTSVLSQADDTPALTVSPLSISKAIGLVLFAVIVITLFIDGYITLKNQTHRLTGSSISHISFLAIILLLMLFTRQGSIF